MKLKELLSTVKYSDVLPVLTREYDTWNKIKGKLMFDTLVNMEPVESDLTSITVEWVEDKWEYEGEIEDDSHFSVSGIDANNDTWAIDFLPWNKIIGLEIINNENLSNEELVAHILWELSYYGYDEETIRKEDQKLKELIEEAESEYKKGKLKTYSLDELKELLLPNHLTDNNDETN